MAARLDKKLKTLKHIPLELFCENVKSSGLGEKQWVSQRDDACLLTQMQFLSLVGFFTGDNALENLVKKYKKTLDDVYELSDSEIRRASQLSPGQVPAFLENLRQEILRDSTRINESNSALTTIYRRYGGLLTPPPNNPTNFMCREVVKLMGPSLRGWSLVKYLGGGAYGKVFLMKTPQGKSVAVKIQKLRAGDDPKEEVRLQKIFAGYGLGPNVIKHTSTTTASGALVDLIAMEPIDYTVREVLCMSGDSRRKVEFVADQIVSLMERMKRYNLTHGDMHEENIAFRVEGGQLKPLLIDFGFSGENIHFPEVDAEQLIRVLVDSDFGVPYPHTDILADKFRAFLRRGGSKYTIKGTSNAFDNIHDEYLDRLKKAKRKGGRKKVTNFLSESYSDDDEIDDAFSYYSTSLRAEPEKKKPTSHTSHKKACRPDQYRNPATGRCRKKSRSRPSAPKKVVRRKACKSYQYRHPVTKRCRNK
jgi:hypothetical protein